MKPIISVITPAYNAEAFLAEAIHSVKAQSYTHWEHLIVVDAKSSDKTLEIARSYAAKDARIKVIHETQAQGVAANRNLAINSATGDYLAFLDSDDLWHHEKLEKQLHFMIANNISFSFHSYQPMRVNGQKLKRLRKAPAQVTYQNLLADNCIGCLTVMIRKDSTRQILFKDEFHEDYCLWLDILKEQKLAHGMQEVLAYYRVVPASRSNNKRKAAIWRWDILRNREQLDLLNSVYHFSKYAVFSLRHRIGLRPMQTKIK